ncbi:MAG: TetR/AcrR family transcriptional regulator [Alphaproteobacteria bacterium]|nr:TetR/AcrR family transcriptional regulator [Alphaproteobacteria bacterium]
MARPRQFSDHEILEIARACFLEQGPGVSTTVIAERVGLSQAALFKRFKTKKDLMMAALLPPAVPPFVDLMEAGPTEGPIADQLVAIAHSVFSFFQEIVPCVATLHASGFDKDDLFASYDIPPPIRTNIAMTRWFVKACEQGRVRQVPPVDLATAFLGTLHVRAFMKHVGAPFPDDPSDYIRNVVDVFVNGVEEAR